MKTFELVKCVYEKTPVSEEELKLLGMGDMIFLNAWLALDLSNLLILNNLVYFTFWMSPSNYFKLLWLNIPKKKTPFLKFIKKKEVVNSEVKDKVMLIMDWSEKEYDRVGKFIEAEVKKDEKFWFSYLGIDGGQKNARR